MPDIVELEHEAIRAVGPGIARSTQREVHRTTATDLVAAVPEQIAVARKADQTRERRQQGLAKGHN
jgi:hypothetical protein